MRVKKFHGSIHVSNEYLKAEPEQAVDDAHAMLGRQFLVPLKGPRGGRYEAIGEMSAVERSDQDSYDWAHNVTRFGATRMAKYVRPHR